MRVRSVVPLLFSVLFLVLAALLLTWGSPPPPSFAAGATWTDLQGPRGGPAQALALNPNYPADQTVFAGGWHDWFHASWKGYGLFRSLDSGMTWGPPGIPADGSVLDVAFSPAWHTDGFAAAGLWQGVWLTHDRGETWQQVSGMDIGAPGAANALAISSPTAGAYTVLAGGPWGGLYRSPDGGITWGMLFDPGGVSRLLFDPLVPNMAWAATGTGLWRSTDSGLKWTQVTTATTVSDVAIGPNRRIYAIFANQAWYSANGGGSWQPIAGPTAPSLRTMGASADQMGLFMAADSYLYRYDVAANALLTVTTNLPRSTIEKIVLSPHFGEDKTLWVGDYNGVWISQDAGATFTRGEGFVPFPLDRVVAAAPPAENPQSDAFSGDIFAAGDEGVWRLHNGSWQPMNHGMLGQAATVNVDLALSPAYAQDHTLFTIHALANALGATLFRSQDGGVSWDQPLGGLEYMNQVLFSPDYAQDRRVYLVATKEIRQSADGGTTWARQPFWDGTHTARKLAASPTFAQDHTLIAVGDRVYRSTDAGASWAAVAGAPALAGDDGKGWTPTRLHWAQSGRLYLALASSEATPPYLRHDQLWASTDAGQTWTRITTAPDLPVYAMTTGPANCAAAGNGGEALYLSTFDDQEVVDPVIPPDLYASCDGGATWQNLGAIPNGAAFLAALPAAPGKLLAGNRGVWLLETAAAPTATPNPVRELLANRSFEYEGVWRIPDTPYDAAYSREQHFAGYWSMRTGIVDPAANVYSFSDFSQDVTLPVTGTVTLRLHRWAQSGVTQEAAAEADLPEVQTLEDFYRALDARAGDLQYALLIEQPGGTIRYLYRGLNNGQAWEEKTFDLSAYLGKKMRLQFGTYNDGSGPVAAQYFDVIELQAVAPDGPAATPTVMPTAMPTGGPTLTPRSWLPYLNTGKTR
jgi:photosystem II stability/assembly factor-like uncharacterized protein